MSNFAKALLAERKGAGLKLRQLSEASGLDSGYLSRLANGKTKQPRRATVIKIADAIARLTDRADLVATQERLRRILLQAAGLSEAPESVLEDTKRRFATRLEEEGLQPHQIEAALDRVTVTTMQRVLSGDEPIEKYPLASLHDPAAKLNLVQEVVVLPDYGENFSAGKRAAIRVSGQLNDSQRALLASIAKLVRHVVEDRPA